MKSKDLFRALDENLNLLPCPGVASRVIEAVASPDLSAGDLESIILCDPALTARMLKIANSAYYGLRQEVGHVCHAIVLLGFRTTRNIATTAALGAWFKRGRRVGRMTAHDIWRHSLHVAVAAEVLARRLVPEADPDDGFLAGLLHDLGILAEFEICPKDLEFVFHLRETRDLSHVAAERQALGTDHCHVGQTLLRRWSLPQSLRDAVSPHHAYERSNGDLAPLAKTVALAEAMCAGRDRFSDGMAVEALPQWAPLVGAPELLESLREQIATGWESAQTWD